MVRYLSCRRGSLKYVAEYDFNEKSVIKDVNNNYISFALILEEGMREFILGNRLKEYLDYFRKKGEG